MHRFTTQALILAVLTATSGCSSNSLFGKRRVNLDSTFADSSATARYPDDDTSESTSAAGSPGILAAVNYKSAPELIEEATRLAESAGPNENVKLIESRSLFQRALKLKPDDPTTHHQLAILSDKLKDFDESKRHYEAAIAKRPKDANVLSDFGYSYFLQKQYDQAEKMLTAALEVDPDHAHAAVNLGAVHGALGNYDEAVSWFRRGGTETEAQRNLAEFFPQGRSSNDNIAGTSGNSDTNPFAGLPVEIQPERLIPANRTPDEMAARLRQTAAIADRTAAVDTASAQLPVIHPGTSTAPHLQTPTASNPFETGFVASPSPQFQSSQQQQVRQQQFRSTQPAQSQLNPFENTQPRHQIAAPRAPVNNTVQQVRYDEPGSLPMWPHSPNQQLQSNPSGPAPTVTIQPGATTISTSQLPTIHPGPRGSGMSLAVNQANGMQPAGQVIQQTSGQRTSGLPQVDRNAQFIGMNAGPGSMFPVQGNGQTQTGNFNAQVNQLQQNARNLIPQPAQNFIHNTAGNVASPAPNAVNNLASQGADALNQIPHAQYPDANAAPDQVRNTLGNIVDQYHQPGQTGQPTHGQIQQPQQPGRNFNNTAQPATNPFADQQLPQIFPGAPGSAR